MRAGAGLVASIALVLSACPDPPRPPPAYPWDAMRPAIAQRLPWSSYVLEEVPCGFDPGPKVLSLKEDGGVPLPAFLHARGPRLFQPRLAVFRPTWVRMPASSGGQTSSAELSGWLFVIDGASLEPLCQAPLEVRVDAAEGTLASQEAKWRAAFEASLDSTRERLRVGATAPGP